ncbi:Speckle-type POZ protein B [Araneus ventricosus]|uniref:Speckle-type POZ protein B n=1 Tax=Araneus ventricosus TaxID=182803 RepID=A0A4Y2JP11_ARAVE|nr:Speckle-type POZ protein B [Araneus ventricosus]
MKENVKNMVDILDLDVDTVYRMLIFMYTDKAGNLDWETSKKLYFAADKYGLITLKCICSKVLKQNLSVTNLREVLALANMHADDDLKKEAIEFFCDHETEVMFSTEWKSFMTEDVHLAAETMHHIFLKKAGNRQ